MKQAVKRLLEVGNITLVQKRRFYLHFYEGMSYRQIVKLDGVHCVQKTEKSCWTGRSGAKILEDERYTGSAIYGRYRSVKVGSKKITPADRKDWIIVPNQYESIITPEDFWNVQERKQKRQRKAEFVREKKQEKRENLFAKK